MAEQEPNFVQPPKDERDTLAAKQKELEKALREVERAEFDVTQKEAFGKFDVTVPNEGEVNYMEYIESRPQNGIVRNGDVLQDTATGKFASPDAYKAQNGSAQEHYDKIGGLENKGEYQPPTYEAMGVVQLAKEAAKARQLGDPAEEQTIREALVHHLTMDAMKDDTETPEEAQTRYESEVTRYEQLVERFVERSNSAGQSAQETHEKPHGEGAPSARAEAVVEVPADASTEDETTLTADVEVKPEADTLDTKADTDTPLEPGAYYKGKKISVAQVYPAADGSEKGDSLKVVDEDGNEHTIFASDITYVKKPEVTPVEDVETEKDGVDEINELFQEETPGTEVELYKAKELTEIDQESAKNWWQKAGRSIRQRGGAAMWAAAWAINEHVVDPTKRLYGKWLNHNVSEEMSDEDKEKRRKRNRYAVILAGAGVAALGIAVLGSTQDWFGGDVTADGTKIGGDGSGSGTEGAPDSGNAGNGSGESEGVTVLPLEGGPETENLNDVPAVEVAAGEGEGGESLFTRYGIDAARWYDEAPTLLSQFPDDFYQEGNDVRIAHGGPLSQGAQDYINSLR